MTQFRWLTCITFASLLGGCAAATGHTGVQTDVDADVSASALDASPATTTTSDARPTDLAPVDAVGDRAVLPPSAADAGATPDAPIAAGRPPIPPFPPGQKKLVYLGWDYPTTQYFKTHVASLDKLPLDGSAIDVLINRAQAWSPENTLGRNILTDTRFEMTDPNFVAAANDMADAKPVRFKYNLFHVSTGYPVQDPNKTFSWFDDKRWVKVANNWKTLANIAYLAHGRGFLVDFEPYASTVIDAFALAAQKAGDAKRGLVKDDAAYKAIARQRGFEVMKAIQEVFPNPEFLFCWGETAAVQAPARGAFWNSWAEHFLLVPAFLEGMRMAATKGIGTKFIDGYEFSYSYNNANQFDGALKEIRDNVKAAGILVAPELYDEFVRPGFGLYLDRTDPRHTPAGFEAMVRASLAKTDQYVWLYSEGVVFFDIHKAPNVSPDFMNAIWKGRGETPP